MARSNRVLACISVAALLGFASHALAGEMPNLPFFFSKPAGDGPFPAVVILHDCSGLGPRSSGAPWRWASELAHRGYVTAWPDSFTPRGRAARRLHGRHAAPHRSGNARGRRLCRVGLSAIAALR